MSQQQLKYTLHMLSLVMKPSIKWLHSLVKKCVDGKTYYDC